MPLQFDHAVIGVRDLDAAIEDYRALGFTVMRGGVHANRATHNALIVFSDTTYLELLAPTSEAPIQGEIDFSAMLWPEGLNGFALRSDDLDADAAQMRASGIDVGYVTAGMRRKPDGTLIEWKLALINEAFAPFLIQDITPREWRIPNDPAVTTHANGALGVSVVGFANLISVPIVKVAADTPYVVQLLCDDCPQHPFDLERTHGVRFEFVSV